MESAQCLSHQDFTNCPQCKCLCLGPTILPCGHRMCRKCLRTTLMYKGENASCPSCGHRISRRHGQTISELADELGKDVILEKLVLEELGKRDNGSCLVCPDKAAEALCLDCGEKYCKGCSSAHEQMGVSKDHVQLILPAVPSSAAPPATRVVPSDSHSSSTSRSTILDIPETSLQGASSDSGSSSKNSPTHELNSLKMKADRFKQGISQLDESIVVVQNNVEQLLRVKTRLEQHKHLLRIYSSDLEKPDHTLLDHRLTMKPRLRRVLQDCQPPMTSLVMITKQINNLVKPDKTSDKNPSKKHTPSFDPMTSHPVRQFITRPYTSLDTRGDGPWISSITTTQDGRLVMADQNNKMVKVVDMNDPTLTVYGVKLDVIPRRLAVLRDGQVAVTVGKKCIYFLDISKQPSLVSRAVTKRDYRGLSSMLEDENLIASSSSSVEGPARVDVISRQGVVIRTIVDETSLPSLVRPLHLFVHNREILISENKNDVILKVDLETGHLLQKFEHVDMKGVRQVAADKHGNCYSANRDGQCVFLMTPSGQGRKLLQGRLHGDGARVCPLGLCVTDWGVVVTWRGSCDSGYTAVAGYKLVGEGSTVN